MKTLTGLARPGLISLFVATGCSAAPQDESDETASTQQAIINGTNVTWNSMNVVAVYHQIRSTPTKFVWSTRPCSGRILTPRATNKAILTARHCVTETIADFAGPTISASQIRISAELAPGPASPKPPNSAVQPSSVHPFPSPTNGYLGLPDPLDLAIIWVVGAIPGLEPNPPKSGLYLGSTRSVDDVSGSTLSHWGYGWGTEGDDSTSGVLRSANGFAFSGWLFGDDGPSGDDFEGYFYNSPNPGGARVSNGDSGGPAFRHDAFPHQVGVHQGEGSDYAISRRSVQWIVDQHLGRLYIRPYNYYWRGMKWSGFGAQATVTSVPAAAEQGQWWAYDWERHAIRIPVGLGGTTCLDLQWNNPADNTPIWMWPCDYGEAQRWIITANFQIKSEVHNKCIEHTPDFRMVLKTCEVVDRQKWLFDPDSGVAGGF